jgi:hypothetical protein
VKSYVVTSGIVFALVTLAHLTRIIAEGAHLLRETAFVILTLIAVALTVWAFQVLRHLPPA